ncbi:hypothetical protein WICANDRAFT_69698 [Wickerhamomyces anomalus NRRL Y-366-8]|uniref:CCZ1/INTU/HSP4 first Longin domain-containing protein n=1 Tax=Wickerhamomyces anomalus (strain ATCC 58044 / CBS 1984 / NCYC 433 / NRRL Y-366-8) TaxID=683960 RepID=A0A1E3P1H9_WICAA|nr:uncharacterized protein WICANDRAFT_69698 [Wickerhamomyces anomalus NRRL Y-366-8]ODQ59339.1 hypothetical protein WICANDRAFT_69698 [Wickerhamomyces anomalus NRRL Y-366-8]
MDFFNGKIDAQITPASLQFLAITNPSLSKDEEDSINQVLAFISNEQDEEITDNYKLNKIGIIQGINSLIGNFDNNDSLNYIELDNQLIIFDEFESKYQIMLSLNLTQIKDDGVIEHTSQDIAPVEFLIKMIYQGYNDFRLHNGSFGSMSSEIPIFKETLTKWWTIWFKNLPLGLIENGSLKLYPGFKKANSSQLEAVAPSNSTNFYIFNTSRDNPETYGLLHDSQNNLTIESKLRFLNWIEEQDNYTISSQSLILPQVLKNIKLPDDASSSEIVYDPFKLVFNTLSDISRYSGVTGGVNASVNGVSNGFSSINGYLPSWMGGKSQESGVDEDTDERATDNEEDTNKDMGFLIGKVGDDILEKTVWLQLGVKDEEQKFRVVVFKYFELLFITIYEDGYSKLDDVEFYKDLKQEFVEIGQGIKIDEIKEKNFYFMIYDKFEQSISSNLPDIPNFDDDEVNDLKYFHDLSKSQTQSKMLHKEIIKLLEPELDGSDHQLEKLKRTKNGWWIYKLNHQNIKEILIIKKWQLLHKGGAGSADGIRNKILDNSTSILGSIGKDAKLWLEDYLTKNQV